MCSFGGEIIMENNIEKTEALIVIEDNYGEAVYFDKGCIKINGETVELHPNGASAIVDFLNEKFDLKPKVYFETEYQLEEFRKIQFEYFNDNGEVYANLASHSFILNTMLKLINQLEMELKNSH
jgi:hypothetical protein